MSQAKQKVKGNKSSPSPATVDNINLNPNDPSVQAAKMADDANPNLEGSPAHTLALRITLEKKAQEFVEGFKAVRQAVNVTGNKFLFEKQNARTFIEGNRAFLRDEIFSHLNSNKGKKPKNQVPLLGCLTVETFCTTHLKVSDTYVNRIFRQSFSSYELEDGTKVVTALTQAEKDAARAAAKRAADAKKQKAEDAAAKVTQVNFADRLARKTVESVINSVYPSAEKLFIVNTLITELQGYAEELNLEDVQKTAQKAAA